MPALLRVLLVTPGYPPMRGGIETHVHYLAEGLAAAGHNVSVWSHGAIGAPSATTTENGVAVTRFRRTRSERFPVSRELLVAAHHQLPERDGIVHVHSYHATPALSALYARSTPVVFTPHYHGVGHTRLAALAHVPYRPLGSRVFARADRVIAVSGAEAHLLTDRYPSLAGRLEVVRHGADTGGIAAAKPFPGEPPTLLVAGRQESYKRVDSVLAAFDRVAAGTQLVITGDGADGPRLRQLAASSSRAADVRLLGHVPLSELWRWQRTAHVLVNMSEQEAFGLVAIEALAAGAHAVLSDIPAHRETAELAPPGQVTLIASSAQLAPALDRALAAQRPGPARVRTWADAVAEHEIVYRTALTRRS